ncbi:MAG: hypothetical protein ABIJ09_20505 [Pseudomonadota bacterium]
MMILAVRTDELNRQIPPQPFRALPREEIDRLHASVEVHAVPSQQVQEDSAWIVLASFTLLHFNYSWFTCAREPGAVDVLQQGERSLGLAGFLEAADDPPLFLDAAMSGATRAVVEARVVIPPRMELRLAGLLRSPAGHPAPGRLALVHVVRLRQPGIEACTGALRGILFAGNTELQQSRTQFDPWSQVLIDHLQAL